jgi:hypothetical protein
MTAWSVVAGTAWRISPIRGWLMARLGERCSWQNVRHMVSSASQSSGPLVKRFRQMLHDAEFFLFRTHRP